MRVRVLVRQKGDRPHLLLYFIDPSTGREVSKSAGTADKREAERAAALWEQELATYRGERNDGWLMFRDRFRDEHLASLSGKSQDSFGTALNHYQRLMQPATLSDVTAASMSIFQAKLLGEGRKLTSIATYMRHLRTAFNWAAAVEMIARAPRVKLPKQDVRTFMRGRPITEAEYKAMLEACDSPPLRRFMQLLWLSGMRLGEAVAFSWDRPPIIAKMDTPEYPQIWYYAEGHKARRDDAIPMTPELAAWMRETPPDERHGLVAPLPWKARRRVSEAISAIGEACEIIVNEAGEFASAHDFRRAFGSRWSAQLMPPILKQLMRHADISTTLKYYVGSSTADAGRALWGVPKNVPKTAETDASPANGA